MAPRQRERFGKGLVLASLLMAVVSIVQVNFFIAAININDRYIYMGDALVPLLAGAALVSGTRSDVGIAILIKVISFFVSVSIGFSFLRSPPFSGVPLPIFLAWALAGTGLLLHKPTRIIALMPPPRSAPAAVGPPAILDPTTGYLQQLSPVNPAAKAPESELFGAAVISLVVWLIAAGACDAMSLPIVLALLPALAAFVLLGLVVQGRSAQQGYPRVMVTWTADMAHWWDGTTWRDASDWRRPPNA